MQRGRVSVVDVAPPDGPGVRVRVSSAGICGLDLHLVENGGVIADGTTLGHEMAGITDDGTPVAIEPLAPCGACEPCQRGEYNLCDDSSAMIYGIGRDGGMADSVCGAGRDVDLAAALMAKTPELADTIITHRYPLDAAREAFEMAANRSAGAIKVVLEP